MKDELAVKITDKGEFYLMTVYDNVTVSPENMASRIIHWICGL